MKDEKRSMILDAATKIFAEKGYQYATISEVAKEAGISTGLLYSYFKNKLDLLLSVVLLFWQNINQTNQEKLTSMRDPFDKLVVVLHNIEDSLIKDKKALYLIKVLNEALPHIIMIKEKELQEKRQSIILENRKLLDTIDEIIIEGQKRGVFDNSLNPGVLRQILCGSIEMLINGLFFQTHCNEKMGYDLVDAHKGVVRLIEKFIGK
ncbi:MAG: TetR/AcrR family transcriptional regulator [Deltaproteobacteria bacterium]|nr:TetR/AcrR family transcriptional regulator [Deltaproteobacteria bacterium]